MEKRIYLWLIYFSTIPSKGQQKMMLNKIIDHQILDIANTRVKGIS